MRTGLNPAGRIFLRPPTAPRGGGAGPIFPNEFNAVIRRGVSLRKLFEIYSERVSKHFDPAGQVPFVKVLMARAKWLFEFQNDIDSTIKVWTFTHSQNIPANSKDRIIRTMVEVGNKVSDQDLDATIKIWSAAYRAIGDHQDPKARGIISNMWVFVRRYLSGKHWKIVPAIKVLHAVYSLCGDSNMAESVVSYIMSNGANSRNVRYEGTRFLGQSNRHGLNPSFHARAVGGLLYYDRDYPGVINFVDSFKRPTAPLLALKAEALRKQQKPDQAIKISNRLLKRFSGRTDLSASEARVVVDSLCCRGYCRTEKGKASNNQRTLSRAVADFNLAIRKSKQFNLPVPPRSYTGLSRAYELQGEHEKAVIAAQKALQIDHNSKKALKDIARLTPPPA